MKQNRLIQMRLLAFALCAAFLPSCATVPQASSPERAPVVIVGAGLTGLTVAYKLQAAGIPAIILEANSRIGGRVQTVYFKGGIYAEAHMEEYFERSPAVPLLRELKLPLSQDVAHSSIRMDDKIYPYTGEGDRDAYLSGVFSPDEKAAFMQWNRRAWEIYEQLHATFFHGKPIPSDLEKLERQKIKLNLAGALDDGSPCVLTNQIYVHKQGFSMRSHPMVENGWRRVCRLSCLSVFGGRT